VSGLPLLQFVWWAPAQSLAQQVPAAAALRGESCRRSHSKLHSVQHLAQQAPARPGITCRPRRRAPSQLCARCSAQRDAVRAQSDCGWKVGCFKLQGS
jgi:hypothetical protein